MTCALSLLVFAGGSQFLAVATIAAGGTPLAAVVGGVVLNARHLPYGLAIAPLLRGPLWKRALSSQIVLDESTALALSQPTPELGRLAFYACGCMLFVAWNLGTLVGALAGGAIADPSALGLDAAFAASMLALLAPLLRRRDMLAAALAGGAIALIATPFAAPGVPILLAAGGALAARLVREGRRVTWWAVIALAVGTYALKAAGPLALGSRTVPPQLQRALTLVSVTLLAGLVAISTFGSGRGLALDARAAGLGVALRRGLAAGAVRGRRDRRDGCAAALRALGVALEPAVQFVPAVRRGINYSEAR